MHIISSDTFLKKIPLRKQHCLVFFVALLYLCFSFYNLSHFTVADEQYWKYERIPQYWKALETFDWEKTQINDKPGVTLALVSGIRFLSAESLHENPPKPDFSTADPTRPQKNKALNYLFRIPIVIFNFFLLFVFYWLLNKLTENEKISLLALALVALSPVLVGISQIINPDALLWSTSFASLLSFLAYLKNHEKKFAAISALFLGLAILSKYTATIFYPFFFVLMLTHVFFPFGSEVDSSQTFGKKMLPAILAYFAVLAGSILVFSLLMPASLVNPLILWKGTLGYAGLNAFMLPIYTISLLLLFDIFALKSKIGYWLFTKTRDIMLSSTGILYFLLLAVFFLLIINFSTGLDFLHLRNIPFDIKYLTSYGTPIGLMDKFLLEFRILVFSIPPFLLAATLFIWMRKLMAKKRPDFIVFSFSLFILIYFAAVISKNLLATIRYDIILYPLLAVPGAYGLSDFFAWQKIKLLKSRQIVFATTIILSLISLVSIAPFYFNYTSRLLPTKYSISDAWGYAGYSAARFANTLPDAEKSNVFADYFGFCEYFIGQCSDKYPTSDKNKKPFDYYALTRRGRIRFIEKIQNFREPMGALMTDLYSTYMRPDPLWTITIDNRPENSLSFFKSE